MLRIYVNGMRILGRPEGDDLSGLFVGPDGFQGWDDAPGGRRDSAPRPLAHGNFDTPLWRDERVFSIDGHALASSEAALGTLRDRVTGVGGDGQPVLVRVEHQASSRWANARVDQATFRDSGRRGGLLHAAFSMQFVAADMRKYGGVPRDFPGASVRAFHRGNFPATPVVEVPGSLTAPYSVSSQGRTVTVTQSLTSSQTHRIDMATGWVYRNGVLQLGVTSVADVFTIPPGDAVLVTGPASMVVRVADTYI